MSSKNSLRLVLIDPDDDLRFLLKTLLEMTGCQVETAKNGSDAVAVIKATPPDVIFTDILLSDGRGLDFGKQVRSMPCARDTLLIALTGHYYQGITQDAWAAGFDRFLLKPVQFDQILSVLKAVAISRGCHLSELSGTVRKAAA
jgi:CheY-like chemotaxis protein